MSDSPIKTVKFYLMLNDIEVGPFEFEYNEEDYHNMSKQDFNEQLESDMWEHVCDHELKVVKE